MDPNKRNVTTIRLRGEKSDGIYLPLSCLEPFGDTSNLKAGDSLSVFNSKEICRKYIPAGRGVSLRAGAKDKKKKTVIAPTFFEHADTSQLAYNLGEFRSGDNIEITLKMHGTSQRTGYHKIYKGQQKSLLDKLLRRPGVPVYDWDYISGTRRTVLDSYDGGFYGSNQFREQYHNYFIGKLRKGETVYYEVVGFTHTGAPIMSTCDNKKLGKDFVKQYGKTTIFSYGCHPQGWNMHDPGCNLGRSEPQSDIYVYRMTMTNEDGDVVEYTPDYVRYRCEQMNVKTVPLYWRGVIPDFPASESDNTIEAGEWVKNKAEMYYDGADPIGKNHIKEGVVVRIVNRPTFSAYKYKNFEFKYLENIIKSDAVLPDMEEAEDIKGE